MFDFPPGSPGAIVVGPGGIRYEWRADLGIWVALGQGGVTPALPIAFAWSGKPPAGSQINVPIVTAVTVPAYLIGTSMYAGTWAASSVHLYLYRVTAGVPTQIGDLIFLTGSGVNTANSTGGPLAVGDVLRLVAPTQQDANLADVGITVHTLRQ